MTRGKPFQKGVSGNPGGRPKEVGDIRELARERTQEALDTLLEVMSDREAPHSARVSAACAVLDRGYGKPGQQIEKSLKLADEKPEDISDPAKAAREVAFLLAAGAAELKKKKIAAD